jgi:hypothetical protein
MILYFSSDKELKKHREQCATLVRLLNKMTPQPENSALLDWILSIFFCLDSSLFQSVIDWLQPCCGRQLAVKTITSRLSKVSSPLGFYVNEDNRSSIGCFAGDGSSAYLRDDQLVKVPFISIADTCFEGSSL